MALTPDAIPHLSTLLTAPDPAADAGLAEGLAALESYKKKDPAKGSSTSIPCRATNCLKTNSLMCGRFAYLAVVVRFKAVGNAPIMKQNFFRVTVSNRFQAVIQFLRKELGWKSGEPLVSISPSLLP
jgi:ubiquitin-like protein ATG12